MVAECLYAGLYPDFLSTGTPSVLLLSPDFIKERPEA